MASFDFKHSPITEDTTIKAQYCCPPPAPIELICLTPGTVTLTGRWVEPVLADGILLAPHSNLNYGKVEVGQRIKITASADYPDAFKKWESFYPQTAFASSADGATFSLSVQDMTAFLTDVENGVAPSNMFYVFCAGKNNGAIREIEEGSFDTSMIKKVGPNFFYKFNAENGPVKRLPKGSFNISNISGDVPSGFFAYFNSYGKIEALPDGSFDTSNITGTTGNELFGSFNSNGAIEKFPEGSFNTSNITKAGSSNFFRGFIAGNYTESLPEGSFDFSNVEGSLGDYALEDFCYGNKKIKKLPEGSFRFPKVTQIPYRSFYQMFMYCGFTELPEGSFNFDNVVDMGGSCFSYFNYAGKLEHLPKGSFSFKNLKTITAPNGRNGSIFNSFNRDGSLKGLPKGSFAWGDVTINGNIDNSFQWFNTSGALTEGNRGVAIRMLTDATYFNVGSQTDLTAGSIGYVNADED